MQSHTTPHVTPLAWSNFDQAGGQPEGSWLEQDTEFFSDAGFDLDKLNLRRNAAVAQLYEDALMNEGAVLSAEGALINFSGTKTGRSPRDKRIVHESTSKDDIWWGPVNIKMDEHTFEINRERAIDYLNTKQTVYVFDGYAGWDPDYRIKIRVICARAYHALFMNNMLIRPTAEELRDFGEPDFTIYNAGEFPANRFTKGMTSQTSVQINFKRMEMVILGTEYAGEMKKGVFSVMHYLMPAKFGQLSLHAAANVGESDEKDVTLFFGLSGTGKTTLSADPSRRLIGDDEHVWSSRGIFNIEGGCYAKCHALTASSQPTIYAAATRFGSVLENVVYDPASRHPRFDDISITENTRVAYPLDAKLVNAVVPAMSADGAHPRNIIMLTCDAFGVLPPVSRLTPDQAVYHFLAGYTSKTPGTEEGVAEPVPTFSTCYSAPFLTLHPTRYATMLSDRIRKQGTACWLVNTGWVGGKYGIGSRISLKHTRAIIDAIHSGALSAASELFPPPVTDDFVDPHSQSQSLPPTTTSSPTEQESRRWAHYPTFNLYVPTSVPGVPSSILNPGNAWTDEEAFDRERTRLAGLFRRAFRMFEHDVDQSIKDAGPDIPSEPPSVR